MNILSRRTHGFLDYLVGVFLIVAPRLFGYDTAAPEARVLVFLGVAAVAYSMLTNYEFGLIRVLPFKAHLRLDVLGGILLALSPWLFGFSERVWGPHLLLGLTEIGAAAMTRTGEAETHDGAPGAPAHG